MRVPPPDRVNSEQVVDFDVYHLPGARQDFHRPWLRLQSPETPPIVWSPYNGGHWIATRSRVIRDISANEKYFSSRVVQVPKSESVHYKLIPHTIDSPRHRGYRNLFNSSFNPKAIAAMEGQIRETATLLIENVRARGSCDFKTEYAELLPIRIFLQWMDVPLSDAKRLKLLADRFFRPEPGVTLGDAIRGIKAYLSPLIGERRGKEGTDLISRLINGTVDGEPVTHDDALDICVNALVGGLDTVVNSLGMMMLHIARNPAQRRQLRDKPALIPDAVEEMFRRYGTVTTGREVKEDVVYEGANLARGEIVLLPTFLVGLDPDETPDPLTVDFDRSTIDHLAFGAGVHRCVGSGLARSELRISFEEWLARIPEFELVAGAELSFTTGLQGTVEKLPLVWQPNRPKPS